MVCSRCGRDVSAASARCANCGASRDTRVATSVLTPPPAVGDAATLPPPGVAAPDDLLTLPPGAPSVPPNTAPAPSGPAGTGGPLTVGQAFGGRYHIIRLLGIGGMGAVYHAWDAELGVAVAIKVIRPEVMADPTAAREIERRFKRELLLARQVTHRNVVRIHDLGEISGIKYITMPFVNGSDLASILKNEERLPVAKALKIARPIVSGLVAAHQAGVVHRDLKPANIMIGPDNDAMIMDFGIARSTSASNDDRGGSGGAGRASQRAAAYGSQTMAG